MTLDRRLATAQGVAAVAAVDPVPQEVLEDRPVARRDLRRRERAAQGPPDQRRLSSLGPRRHTNPVGHEQALRRPVLIVSADPWLISDPPVIAILPLTRTQRNRSTHVEVEPGTSGLAATSYAKCEDIRAVSPLRLQHRMGSADAILMPRIDLILTRLLGL